MAHTLNCPNCGAPLDYEGHDPIIRCPYCRGSVIVPENLRARPSFSARRDTFAMSSSLDLNGLVHQAQRLYQVKHLAEEGETDRAVALYREIIGADEFTARQAVAKLTAGQPIVFDEAFVLSAGGPAVTRVTEKKPSPRAARFVGCLFAAAIAFALVSVIVPLAATLGLTAWFGITGFERPGGVEIPLDLGNLPVPGLGLARQELAFGGSGSGPGLFDDVRAIGVHPVNGSIYAANYADGRVQAFDPQGNFLTQWIIPKEKTAPYFDDMAVGRDGTIYIPVYGKLRRFDANGQLLGEFDLGRDYVQNLDVNADGTLVVIANGEDILWLSPQGEIQRRLDDAVSSVSGDSELSASVAVDGLGKVFVMAHFNDAIFVFDANGRFLNRFGSDGDAPGQFRGLMAIEVDNQGRVFVSDVKGIQVFSNDGRYLDLIPVAFSTAYGLAFDDQNKLYITTGNQRVEKFTIRD